MPPVFHVPENQASIQVTVVTARSSGGPSLVVSNWPGTWTAFPKILVVRRVGVLVTALEATGISGATLTISGPIDGYADAAQTVGDTVEVDPTALSITELQSAINTINGMVASDAIATATALRLGCWGDSLTAGLGGTSYPTQLEPLINRDCFNGGVGGDTSTMILTRFLAATDKHNFSTVIWAGINDQPASISPSTTKANIASMVAALGHTRFLVLSILNDSVQISGSPVYIQVTGINSNLASTYGSNYFDLRAYLVSQYNPNIPQDVTDHGNDVVPTSLRSDGTHLNTAGYLLVAQQVAAKMAVLNPPMKSLVSTNMGSLLAAPAGPIGSVEPTDGAFSNLTGKHIATSGDDAFLIITRRDNGVQAWGFYSASGIFQLYNTALGVDALTISPTDNSVTFAGDINAGNIFGHNISTAGGFAGVSITRRDTGAQAWVIYSDSGPFKVYNSVLNTDALAISPVDNSAKFYGPLGLNGANAAAQHAAIADATNATDVIAQLNTLLAYLRLRGDIAT